MMTFVDQIANNLGVPLDNLMVQYLNRKTKAADRGSKARRSLGNLYAIHVLAEDYLENKRSRFSDLLSRMKALPFGAKLQNHPLDNRVNDEFSRQYHDTTDLLPIIATEIDGQKARQISVDLLRLGDADPTAVASVIVQSVSKYIELITENQTTILREIDEIRSLKRMQKFFADSFSKTSDARLFEVASYVLLSEHYRTHLVYTGNAPEAVEARTLSLFKTGRTNANDGGIDFVLRPLGRFFQVTETLDFRKYFLDFEKVNRFPITFVIKVAGEPSEILKKIEEDARKSGQYDEAKIALYMGLFEEVITLDFLKQIAASLDEKALARTKGKLKLQFQLEFGLLD